jgi:hypothetical protein
MFVSGKVAKNIEKTKEEILGKLALLNLEAEEEGFEDDLDAVSDHSSSSEC